MKIAVIIPDRGDRPEMLKNCLRIIKNQTVKPDHIELVDDVAISNDCDITRRYRIGYNNLRNKNFDAILLMENDDYYSNDYIEIMLSEWEKQGRPNMLGTKYTIYYHIGLNKWFTFEHHNRSSAMSTLIKPDLTFGWCPDNEPYTDIHLWKNVGGVIFEPTKHICLGIKHGTTKTGGGSHISRLYRYINDDTNKKFLKTNTDTEGFNFLTNFTKKHGTNFDTTPNKG